jgi:hypothetical protein
LTILDDDGDARPRVSIAPGSVAEGEDGVRFLPLEVTLNKPSSRRITLSYRTSPGSAHAGSDYVDVRGRVTFAPGVTSTTVVVPVLGDLQPEEDETLQVSIRAPRGVEVVQGTATGLILNDDARLLPRLELLPARVVEGDGGEGLLRFIVELDRPASEPVSFRFHTRDGTARQGSDYRAVGGTAEIPAGADSVQIEVPVLGDTRMEEDETLEVYLENIQGAMPGSVVASGTILDDDAAIPPPSPPEENQACEHVGSGDEYSVGPGQPYRTLGAVPWQSLGAGDTVRIHYRAAPYREKIIVSTGGSEAEPLRICGVPGPNGERPILDGEAAINSPEDAAAYGSYRPMEGLALFMVWNRDYDLKVSNLVIDGLHLRNAKSELEFVRTDGTTDRYEEGAACIRIQAADNVVIRNNELENCDNGIFTMAQGYNEAHLTRNLLIEGNYLHGHGTPGSDRSHGVYIQALGVVYQYNRFGPNDPRSGGTSLKERVAGSVIRYNWFDSGSSRALDLVEVEDAAPWYIEAEYRRWANDQGEAIDPERLRKVREAEAAYRDTWVYGNFFRHVGSQTMAGSLVHYGWDNDPALSREGRLHFFNNSVLIREDRSDNWRFRLFDLRQWWDGTFARETVEAYNNIVHAEAETEGAEPAYFCMSSSSGTINLGVSWMPMGWESEEALANCYYSVDERPVVNGMGNLLDTSGAPAPLDPDTLESRNLPLLRDRAQPTPAGHPVDRQYLRHLGSRPRSSANDLGAMELP